MKPNCLHTFPGAFSTVDSCIQGINQEQHMTLSPSVNPERHSDSVRALAHLPLFLYRMLRWNCLRGGWLPGYLQQPRFDRRSVPDGPIDILVLVSDHYEPARRYGDEAAVESVRQWCADYEAIAGTHFDSDGRHPQHTWFHRFDYPNPGCVRTLSESVYRGFGEVEFHLHHGHDTAHSLAARLQTGLDWFNRFGAMCTAEENPRQRFAYVAGNSALDNGAGNDALSGCDTELSVLRDAGCFADFTFPSIGSPAQPRLTNSIYYATEDGRPKSYDTGVPVAVGKPPAGDLMIFQGPSVIDWDEGRVEDSALEDSHPAHPRRLAGWLAGHVHVVGRPEWVFIKLSTHAMQNRASFLSAATDATFTAMETWWMRPPYRLHYVTCREAYNIVKAAEAGHAGNPNDYRDFDVPKPANRIVSCTVDYRLVRRTQELLHLRVPDNRPARVELAEGPVRLVAGRLREVEVRHAHGEPAMLRLEGQGPFEVVARDGTPLAPVPGSWSMVPAPVAVEEELRYGGAPGGRLVQAGKPCS
jgi:hypothetical protein